MDSTMRLVLPFCRTSPLTRSSMARWCGSGISSLVTIHGPIGQNVSMALREREDAGLHLAALDVAGGDVVEDHVAGDVVLGLVGAEELAALADDDGQLELVVELLGQALGVDDRVVRADDRVDVLEEHDALVHRVRPVDGLQLLVVVGEVAGGVEELLRHDRGAQPHVGEGEARPGLRDVARRARSTRGSRRRRARRPCRRRAVPTRPSSNVTSFMAGLLSLGESQFHRIRSVERVTQHQSGSGRGRRRRQDPTRNTRSCRASVA